MDRHWTYSLMVEAIRYSLFTITCGSAKERTTADERQHLAYKVEGVCLACRSPVQVLARTQGIRHRKANVARWHLNRREHRREPLRTEQD